MRIALLSTCAVSTPPKAYGGTELVVAELASQLNQLGHEVTLYATGDSVAPGPVRSRFPAPVWPPNPWAELRHARFAWDDIVSRKDAFDVVQVNSLEGLVLSRDLPVVYTIHHDRHEFMLATYLDFPGVHYAAISQRQADLIPELSVKRVIRHGLDPSAYPAGDGQGGYCAFLGRVAPQKGLHDAIDVARCAGVPLRIGGDPQGLTDAYFREQIAPRMAADGCPVQCLGEVNHSQKIDLLGHASALLMPIDWEEPFGLVMIEAMLVGTPVIAFSRGSTPEVIEEGVTGYVVQDAAQMADALQNVTQLDRRRCRERARARWSSARMAREYEMLFSEIMHSRARNRRGTRSVVTSRMPGAGEAGRPGLSV